MEDNNKKVQHSSFKSGFVAIIGEPNAGKSTLVNHYLGQNLSVVTKKPQTTRQKILGILTKEYFQIIFLDTPGLIEPKYLLQEAMVKSANKAIADADVVLLMSDITQFVKSRNDLILDKLKNIKKPVILALNKVDLIFKNKIPEMINFYKNLYPFREIIPISALKGDGTPQLLDAIVNELSVHQPFYPHDILSDYPEKFFVSEIIRKNIFEFYKEEVPYSAAVNIVEFSEKEGRKDLIRAEIVVEKESQKGILIGKNGQMLKAIGEKSRIEIEEFLGREIYLELFVKVRANWRNNAEWLKRFGYLS